MKLNITRRDLTLLALQVGVWLALLAVPAITTFANTHSWADAWQAWLIAARITLTAATVYFANYCIVVPLAYYRGRRWLYFLANGLFLAAMAWHYFSVDPQAIMDAQPHEEYKQAAIVGYFATTAFFLFVYAALAGLALLVHHVMRSRQLRRQLEQEQQRRTEAELEWLKNQLNPHFLFNTLNNISSLVQIDGDRAQDAIAQLSDLLRYAMYETRRAEVPLAGEVEFMRNYVELMRLRCNEHTTVTFNVPTSSCLQANERSTFNAPTSSARFDLQANERSTFNVQRSTSNVSVAPLLFISLIENAFKHGVSSSHDSLVDIRLEVDGQPTAAGQHLVFCCRNTNYPKDEQNRSGSGIGIENTRRRLELLYPGRYTWEQTLHDNIYTVRVELQLDNKVCDHE